MSAPTALLYLSFGGPEAPEEVMPFLRRVTAGRNIPDERLADVAEHYYHFGGVSPINADNRRIIAALEQALLQRNLPIPVYFGNRNSAPFIVDTVREILTAGHTSIVVFRTSAWGGYSGQWQYTEDITRALAQLAQDSPAAKNLAWDYLPSLWSEPCFHGLYAQCAAHSGGQLRAAGSRKIATVFTAHSVPITPESGHQEYSSQVNSCARQVASSAGITDYSVAWQSRSGNPRNPWLEPDVTDVIPSICEQGYDAVSVVPLGFLTDHLEVLWDLDTELAQVCEESQLKLDRAATVGLQPGFADLIADQVLQATVKAR